MKFIIYACIWSLWTLLNVTVSIVAVADVADVADAADAADAAASADFFFPEEWWNCHRSLLQYICYMH